MKGTKHWLKRIFSEPFDVCDRLKSIDDGYFVVFNVKRDRYEVHNNRQTDTFCFVVPYDKLDSRTVDYCLKTRVQNVDKLIKEMDEQNAAAEAELVRREYEASGEKMERIVWESKK